ncbi:MAG: hypothetical protein FJX42_00055 [Alphaproteobacteria bacterium]|nr:hypothetical protein [Alphaproteobacteria bacterium]
MKQTPANGTAEQHIREIRRQTRKKCSAEEKLRIAISGLRGEHSIAEPRRREGIASISSSSTVSGGRNRRVQCILRCFFPRFAAHDKAALAERLRFESFEAV